MAGALSLSFDITSIAVSTAIPGLAWALLFALAWRRPGFAESLGLGRRTFWLLLPGALLASFALLPVAPVTDDIVAVSLAGAGFPLAVGVLVLGRIAPPLGRAIVRVFGLLVVETTVLLAIVLLADAGDLGRPRSWGTELSLVVLVAVAFTAVVLAAAARRASSAVRAEAGLVAMTSGVLVLTFAGARAIPGVGIAEGFPYFLLPPMFVGAVAVLAAPLLFPGREALALPAAFFSAGWGVVLGADILWQPPLYAPGPGGLYAIGGAGVLDLVYLSGFLGLLGAWGAHRLLGRGSEPVDPPPAPSPSSPTAALREAYVQGVRGSLAASLAASAVAGRAAAAQAQRLLGRPLPPTQRPWDGLGVPGWVVSDQANLDSVAKSGTREPREAFRAYVTARALVRLGEGLGRPRFASIPQRLLAYVLDLVVLGVAGGAVFAIVAATTPGGIDALLSSVAFNAAIYGLIAVALLYFAIAELWAGATVGKIVLGIEVRNRALGPVDGVSAFLRNAPLLPAMTLFSIGLALAVALLSRGVTTGTSFSGLSVLGGAVVVLTLGLVIVIGTALAGAVGVAVMAVTSERQRVGDLWAGTWVVRRLSRTAAPPEAPPGAVRSG